MDVNSHIVERLFDAYLTEKRLSREEFEKMNQGNPVSRHPAFKDGIVIDHFPRPIGSQLASLLSDRFEIRNRGRKHKIFEVAEKLIEFHAFIWIVQLWEFKKRNGNFGLSADFLQNWQHFQKPSIGHYLGLVRSAFRLLEESNMPFFFESNDLSKRIKKFVRIGGEMVQLRNNFVHHTAEVDCVDIEQLLTELLCLSSFLMNYFTVSIKGIYVEKSRFREPYFVHSLAFLNSQGSYGGSIRQTEYSDSHSVILTADTENIGRYLNLSPFVIDIQQLQSDEKGHRIYIYEEKVNGTIHYNTIDSKGIKALNEFPLDHFFYEQWNDLFQTLEG